MVSKRIGSKRYGGKSLEAYQAFRKKSAGPESDSDSESSLSDIESEDDDPDAESDGTVDGSPELIKSKRSGSRATKSFARSSAHRHSYNDNDDDEDQDGEDDDEDEDDDDDDEDDDDEDDDDEDDDDEDSDDTSSTVSYNYTRSPVKKKQEIKKPEKLQIPKRLDLSGMQAKSENSNEPNSSAQASPKNEDEQEEEDEEESSENPPEPEPTVVEHDYDDRLAFPRADNSDKFTDDTLLELLEDDDDDMLKGDDDDDDDEVDTQTDVGTADLADEYTDDDYDENKLEAHEEQAIVDELNDQGDLFSSTPTSPAYTNTPSQEFDGYASDESESDYDNIYYDDFFEPATPARAMMSSSTNNRMTSEDEEDDEDAYLWSYFFSDGSTDNETTVGDDKTPTRPVNNANSANSTTVSALFMDESYDSGDSTDEDLTLPRSNHRKVGGRATEVLSSSSMASRPPILGSWVMTNERPFGIIDGLTTRTLSPPPGDTSDYQSDLYMTPRDQSPRKHQQHPQLQLPQQQQQEQQPQSLVRRPRKRGWSQSNGDAIALESESEMSEIALDEFIYTSDLDDDDYHEFSTPIFAPSSMNGVPLSAFRNRGISTPTQNFYQRRVSPGSSLQHTLGVRGRRQSMSKEAIITPVRSVNKKRRRKKQRQDRSLGDHGFGSDAVEDLVDMSTLSPLFGGIS